MSELSWVSVLVPTAVPGWVPTALSGASAKDRHRRDKAKGWVETI